MPKARDHYVIRGVDLYHVRNRNERRVIKCLDELAESGELGEFSPEMLEDAYAFALNRLPARYTQSGTIVLRDPVRHEEVEDAVRAAILQITRNPR
ncbi:MAG: late competence development ComFB family protein [Desulfovibrio sp.]|jgi:hypothetical protein|nr:late competence development ComFB family protein [Desulfovibrio sp.]